MAHPTSWTAAPAAHRLTLSVLLLLSATLLLASLPPSQAAKNCNSCHKSYDPLAIDVAAPARMGVNLSDSFQVELAVPWKHEALEVTVSLVLPDNGSVALAPGETANKTIASIARRSFDSLSWQLVGVKTGTTTISFDIRSTSHYDHSSSKKPDYQDERFAGDLMVTVTDLELGVSPSFFFSDPVVGGNHSLTLTSARLQGNLSNFTLTGLGALAGLVQVETLPELLGPGRQASLNFSLASGHGAGFLRLDYRLPDGSPANTTLEVLIPVQARTTSVQGSGYFLGVGALYGWLVVVALFAGMGQGLTKRYLDRRYTEEFKAARKEKAEWTKEDPGERQGYWWWLHTMILFVLIIFVYIHVVGVFRGGFPVVYDLPTLLGLVALAILLVTGLSGLWPKRMKQLFGHQRWKMVHGLISAVALVFGLVHGVLLRNVFLV